jgi:hypothetical protein
MRSQFKTTAVSTEIHEADASDEKDFHDDFRTWWKAHVRENRYWGGGPYGGFADNGNYGAAPGPR